MVKLMTSLRVAEKIEIGEKKERIANFLNGIALQPLSDRDREMLSRRFTIDFNYNSNHIEGNTLTLHKVLLREDYSQYKTRPNSVITRYGDRLEYASPEETPALMTDLVNWYNEAEKSGRFTPVELAAIFHYRYIRIHPFEDGNGRIARLLANYILSRHGYPMVVVRSRKKNEYLEALHRTDLTVGEVPSLGAHASKRDIQQFLTWFTNMFVEEVTYNIRFLTERGDNVWWFDGERIKFRSDSTSKILNLIYETPDITTKRLSDEIGINMAAVNKHLKQLTDKGYIQRVAKDGTWRLVITPSV